MGASGAKPRIRRGAGAAFAGTGIIASLLGAPPASAYPVAPAFYTYQAPAGAGTQGRKVIALSFDDGPGPYTPQVLSVLERYHVPATFFDIGLQVANYPQYAKQVAAAGYPVENHTWSHPDLANLSALQVQEQITAAQHEIQSVTGTTPTCLRPPYNAWNTDVLGQVAVRDGLQTMSYSIDPKDWARPGTQAIVASVVGSAFPGAVVDLHDSGGDRSQTVAALPQIITDLEGEGYTFVSICGQPAPISTPPPPPPPQVSSSNSFGLAPAAGPAVISKAPFVGGAATASGYWMAAADGGVFAAGVPFDGSLGGRTLTAPISGIASTVAGDGYWLVARNGGVFTFGSAAFHGSMGGHPPATPVVGIAADPATGGYWLVTSAGGVFNFDAPFEGSMADRTFNGPVVGMAATTDGRGYWLVTAEGAVFTFGDAQYAGGEGGKALDSPVIGVAADRGSGGYLLASAKGGVFTFGAPFDGSMGGREGTNEVFAIVTPPSGSGYIEMAAHPAG